MLALSYLLIPSVMAHVSSSALTTARRLTRPIPRRFSTTTPCRYPGFFDLAARSTSRETAYLRKGSKISHIEFSPALQLLKSESELASGKAHQHTTPEQEILRRHSVESDPIVSEKIPTSNEPPLPPAASPADFAARALLRGKARAISLGEAVLAKHDSKVEQLERQVDEARAGWSRDKRFWESERRRYEADQTLTGYITTAAVVIATVIGCWAFLSGIDQSDSGWPAWHKRWEANYARATDPMRVEPRWTSPTLEEVKLVVAPAKEAVSATEALPPISAASVPPPVPVTQVQPGPVSRRSWKSWIWHTG